VLTGTNRLWAIFTFVALKWPLRGQPRSLRILIRCYQVPISVP
jgi:hypothetical protein